MGWSLHALFILALLGQCQGLTLEVSDDARYLLQGSNLSVSCSDPNINDLDWLKNKKLLSTCTLNDHCRPTGQRFTVDHTSNKSVLNLLRLQYSDCGTYNCTTRKGYQSYKVRIKEPIRDVKLHESDDRISVTTNCILPTYSVDILWFYISKDGLPRLYDKNAERDEHASDCLGACEENVAMRVSSSVRFPHGRKHTIAVKMMAYVRQGGLVKRLTSSKEYLIETCPPGAVRGELVFLVLLVVLCLVLCVSSFILRMCKKGATLAQDIDEDKNKSMEIDGISYLAQDRDKDKNEWKEIDVHVVIAIGICVLLLICCSVLLSSARISEPRLPDILDRCTDIRTTEYVVAVISYYLIVVVIGVHGLYYNPFIRETWTKYITQKQQRKTESEDQSGSPHEEDVEVPAADPETKPLISTPETDRQPNVRDSVKKIEEGSQQDQTYRTEADVSLPCQLNHAITNEIHIDLGGLAILTCIFESVEYPSWQRLEGPVINRGGTKDFEKNFKNRVRWNTDKKSLEIKEVLVSDAGAYICLSEDGLVQTVNLVVILPSTLVKAEHDETTTLKVGDEISRHFPLWRRGRSFLNVELHKKLQGDHLAWNDDNKSLDIKYFNKSYEGVYEVFGDNLIKRFIVSLRELDKQLKVKEGQTVRLECPEEYEDYPAWEHAKFGVFNTGGQDNLRQPDGTERLSWSIDKKSLLIQNIRPEDSGYYLCRCSDGTVKSVILIVESKPAILIREKGSKGKLKIQHNTGYKYPTLIRTGFKGDDLTNETISHQNYQSKKFEATDKNEGKLTHVDTSKLQETTIRCSTFGGCEKVYKIQDKQDA